MDRRVLLGHTGLFFTTLFRVPLRTQNVWKSILVLLEQKCFLCVSPQITGFEPGFNITTRAGLLLNAGLIVAGDA